MFPSSPGSMDYASPTHLQLDYPSRSSMENMTGWMHRVDTLSSNAFVNWATIRGVLLSIHTLDIMCISIIQRPLIGS